MSKVWLITGSGSGLGRVTAEAALKTGHQVVATARGRLSEVHALRCAFT
jgi:NAD(P)-dependent dehydrogenase (short-subunit alcohol dehydrogenase family)